MGSARIQHHPFARLALLTLALAASGCDLFKNDSTSPTANTTETFSGTLAQQGSNVYTFAVAQAGTVSITLTTVTPTATTVVGLGLGTPNGTACTLTSSNPTATAGSTAQIVVTQNPGSYCVRVYDNGTLPAAINFTVTIVHT